MNITAFGSFAGLALTAAIAAQDAAPAPAIADAAALRATVRGAIAFIARQAVPVPDVDGAVLFKSTEGEADAGPTMVYGGTAGVMIFLENAQKELDDATARELADRAAKGLRSQRHVDGQKRAFWSVDGGMGTTGLYTGDAGVGQAFLVRHALRGDADALATAVEIGDALLSRAEKKDDGITWGEPCDIIFGDAGTALFLFDLGKASGAERFTDAARRACHHLLATATMVASTADPQRQLRTWVLKLGPMRRHMPNFSHGTAGVAYALLRVGAGTGDQELVQGARDGADWLLEHAVVAGDGLKWAANDGGGKPVYMGGWCHGPAGTGRLFLLLAAVTGEARYRDTAIKGSRFIEAYAHDAEQVGADGKKPYVPPSYCCGVAGVVDFFCDLHRVTGAATDAAFAQKAGSYLVEAAIADGDGRKWRNGRTAPGGPIAADSAACNVDLMIGAAGEAMALLKLLAIDRDADPVRGLPDRAVTAR